MGRRKGSKNKPKVIYDGEIQSSPTNISRTTSSSDGVSILDTTETIIPRTIPIIKYSTDAARTKGVEKRITSLVHRHKSFYLTTDILAEQSDYFVDSGGWAFAKQLDKYVILIGHVKNLLPFLGGPHPIWQQKRSYQRHNVMRGLHLG